MLSNPDLTVPAEPVTTLFVFRQQLCNLLDMVPGNPMSWRSESDYAVHYCAFHQDAMVAKGWQPAGVSGKLLLPADLIRLQVDGLSDQLPNLDDSGASLAIGRPLMLHYLFASLPNKQAVFHRPTEQSGVYHLYLLAQFEERWVGVNTYVVET